MTPQSWERVKELFAEAQGLSEGDRSALLDSANAVTSERAMAEALLQEHALASGFLESPLPVLAAEYSAGFDEISSVSLPEGTLLRNRYCVRRELGRGGNGIVYLAEDLQLSSRQVVVKVLHNSALEAAGWKRRFRDEMQALARIDHPGVIGVLDVSDDSVDPPFLVMQYIEGATLRAELTLGPLPFDRAACILRQVGDALDAAHARGVVHRDLKPENIMIQSAAERPDLVRLIDFGIAKVEASTAENKTTTLVLVGTTRYMAPEQMLGRASYKSDIYALGVIAYELLTGSCPFTSETPFEVLDLQVGGRFARPRRLRPEIPEPAEAIIVRALDFHPASRPRSAGEFAHSLSAALSRRPTSRWKRQFAYVAVLLALASVGIQGFRAFRPRNTSALARIIEAKNSIEPLDEGFRMSEDASNDLKGTIAFNPDNSGYDGWRVTTRGQGFYVRDLDQQQEDAALRRGFRMSAALRAEQGGAFVIASSGSANRRFDIFMFLDDRGDQAVRLIDKLLPSLEGAEFHLNGSGKSFHSYELRYDSSSQTADLFVDGIKRISGYRGHSEYAAHSWLAFGTHLYRSDLGVATFRTIRFEINP